jgi:glycosyltransferase involved in cell wall biosynthesis
MLPKGEEMKDKIKILFTTYYLGSGGAEKALINLLDMMDYDRYEVDLLLFEHKGLYLSQLNKNVNLLPLIPEFDNIRRVKSYCKWAVLHGKPISAGKRVYYLWQDKHGINTNEKCWNLYMKRFLTPLPKEYDVAVGYLQGLSNWYVAEKVKAKAKFGWIHNDYKKVNYDKNFDIQFFKKFQRVISVSQECTESLKQTFPTLSNRCETLLNLMSPKLIRKKANDPNENYPDNHKCMRLLTIGGLRHQKGFDMAIEACGKLKKKGYTFLWYVIGIGELQDSLLKMVEVYDVKDSFIFLGERENPYPYIKQADIYVQPSYFEGKSIAIDEVKILYKPIVVTAFPSVYDQIQQEKTGVIIPIDAESIAFGIERLMKDAKLRKQLSDNLKLERYDLEETELKKHFRLFEQFL